MKLYQLTHYYHSRARLLGKVVSELLQRLVAVGDGVLLILVHLGVCLSLVFEDGIPAWRKKGGSC